MNLKKLSFEKFKSSLPTLAQWKKLPRVLSKNEKRALFLFSVLAFYSFLFLFHGFYLKNTVIRPAVGGSYVEGVMGQPRFINPIYAPLSDTDRDLTEIVFSGLMKYDEEGKIVQDLAENFEIKEDGKIYEFSLKENVFWSDGQKLTVDDIIFTIEIIQNSDYKSPLRSQWIGIETERISDYKIRFKLRKSSSVFLESTTLKILPKHVWQGVSPENFPLNTEYHLKPIGSGPFKIESIENDKNGYIKSLTLTRNSSYYSQKPFISELKFKFFEREEDLIKAAKKGEINGFSLNNLQYYDESFKESFYLYKLVLPRYFSVFFNPEKSKILAQTEVRKALNFGTNKKEILDEVLSKYGDIIESPILPEIYGYSSPSSTYEFNPEKANQLLDDAGFKDLDGDGFREKIVEKKPSFQFASVLNVGSQGVEVQELQKCLAKDPEVYPEGEITGSFGNLTKEAVIKFQEKYSAEILEPSGLKAGTGKVGMATIKKLNEICFPVSKENLILQISLITVNQSQLIRAADILKNQWRNLGVNLEIKTVEINELEKEFIKSRNYESLLFGEALGAIPDPFPFWHSSQKKEPGLNLAIYENKKADEFLEKARESSDFNIQKENYEKFQNVLIEDAPAVFLYNPDFLYLIKKEVKGVNAQIIIDPSQRFSGIINWHLKTKRFWKFFPSK